jgi:hypothetical protein
MHLNMCDQSPPIPARTKNISQLVLSKYISWEQGHEMYLNCVNQTPSKPASKQNATKHDCVDTNDRKDTKCLSTCADKINPLLARTQTVS